MDRHRDRGGERQRGPSRWSDGPPANQRHPSHGQSRGGGDVGFDNGERHHPYRGGGRGGEPDYSLSGRGGGGGGSNGGGRHHSYRGGGGPHDYSSGGGRGFEGSGRHHPYRGGGDGPPDYSLGGGGGVGGPSFRHGADGSVGHGPHVPMGGAQRRSGGFSPYDRRGSPENVESSNFAKLFIGSVPRTATEEDIRPLFEEHGNVIEVALIKDRRTGQQQGCCFVKYATLVEADRAIRALHNEITLPGGHAPIQVRYADGERERLGAVEYKLFIGSLNKQASEKEIGEIFGPYGHVEDVYIMKDDMKQSRGCGFVKFSHRDMASAAIDGLNGKYTMRGCDQPLTVRFADPKKPRPGESRGGPSFGSPGYGPRSQPPSGPGVWHPPSPRSRGPSDGDVAFKIGAPATSTGFSPSMAQIPLMGQQGMPLQKQVLSPKDLHQSLQAPMGHQVGPMQAHLTGGGRGSFTQSLPGQSVVSMGSQLPTSQPFIQSFGMPASGQQPLTSAGVPSQLLQQSPTQMMLQQQAQSLQSTFHTTQQAFSQLQQQMQHMQPSQAAKQQSAWGSGGAQQPVSTGPAAATVPSAWASVGVQQPVSTGSAAATMPVSSPAITTGTAACNWTEHMSPEGYKYYYNSVTKESKWEKPEELSLFEQQQQKLQPVQKPTLSQVQMQAQSQIPTQMLQSTQQHVGQLQQNQGQMQMRPQAQTMQPAMMYQVHGAVSTQIAQDMAYGQQQARGPVDAARIQQGLQAAQEWIWKNKPAG